MKVERIDGWSKYTIGSFSTYNEAVQIKNGIIAETPERSAFIVAYKNSKRVPIGDVLLR